MKQQVRLIRKMNRNSKSLERIKGKITIIVIAHRLSTIKNADQVIVLDEGEILQKGKFGQLAKETKRCV